MSFISGEDEDSVLTGFTITGGLASLYDGECVGSGKHMGGGVIILDSSPTITDSRIAENVTHGHGGGVYNCMGDPVFKDCATEENSALGAGGGVESVFGSPTWLGCLFSGNTAGSGGGGMRAVAGAPSVTNCVFVNNSDTGQASGGAMLLVGTSMTISDTSFAGNTAMEGGGIYSHAIVPKHGNALTVRRCNFTGNSAERGGAIYNLTVRDPLIMNCRFEANTAEQWGGAIYNDGQSNPVISNCIFAENEGPYGGGAIFNIFLSDSRIYHSTFTANSAGVGGGMMNEEGCRLHVASCVFWNNTNGGGADPTEEHQIFDGKESVTTIAYSVIHGLSSFNGYNNIGDDPLFVDPQGGDYQLSPGSPCIDAALSIGIPFDFNSDRRAVDDPETLDTGVGFPAVADMGAYEFGSSASCPADFSGDGTVGASDLATLLGAWGECP